MFIPSQIQYTFNEDIYKKFRKHFQDLTKDLLVPKFEFLNTCICPISPGICPGM